MKGLVILHNASIIRRKLFLISVLLSLSIGKESYYLTIACMSPTSKLGKPVLTCAGFQTCSTNLFLGAYCYLWILCSQLAGTQAFEFLISKFTTPGLVPHKFLWNVLGKHTFYCTDWKSVPSTELEYKTRNRFYRLIITFQI